MSEEVVVACYHLAAIAGGIGAKALFHPKDEKPVNFPLLYFLLLFLMITVCEPSMATLLHRYN